ncbi:hypothetical protein BC833DRAFT_622738, partial [Globomyces pollinis-pini]
MSEVSNDCLLLFETILPILIGYQGDQRYDISSCCDGKRFDCSNGYITSINLPGEGLSGYIPAEISSFENLKSLNLHNNILYGNIPTELGNLKNLNSLFLGLNQLKGPIPVELGYMDNLQHIGNQLSYIIPYTLQDKAFITFVFDDNNVYNENKPPEFPTDCDNFFNHIYPYLYGSQEPSRLYPSDCCNSDMFECSISDIPNIYTLNFDYQSLRGIIPPSIATLSSLQNIFFSYTGLYGDIPKEIMSLSMKKLFICGNNIQSPPDDIKLFLQGIETDYICTDWSIAINSDTTGTTSDGISIGGGPIETVAGSTVPEVTEVTVDSTTTIDTSGGSPDPQVTEVTVEGTIIEEVTTDVATETVDTSAGSPDPQVTEVTVDGTIIEEVTTVVATETVDTIGGSLDPQVTEVTVEGTIIEEVTTDVATETFDTIGGSPDPQVTDVTVDGTIIEEVTTDAATETVDTSGGSPDPQVTDVTVDDTITGDVNTDTVDDTVTEDVNTDA